MIRNNRLTPVHVIGAALVLGTAALLLFINEPWGGIKPADAVSGKTTATAAQEAGARVTPTLQEPSLPSKPPGVAGPSVQ
jgi:hypothetical protein